MRFIHRRSRSWLALLAALALVAVACTADDADEPEPTPDADADPESADDADDDTDADEGDGPEAVDPTEGGVVLFGEAQEPSVLNGQHIDGGVLTTAAVFNTQFQGAYRINADFEMEPELLDGEAEFTEDPFTVTYTIHEDAAWSDGEPVTAEDFVFTWEWLTDDAWSDQVLNYDAYSLIEDAEIVDDRTVTFTFAQPWSAWQELFDNILPAHVLDGEEFPTAMAEELPPVGTGPFLFDSWDQGTQLRMVRNDGFWGGDVDVEELVMRYVPDTTSLTQQMVAGEVHMFAPQPQPEMIEQLEEVSDRVTYEVGLGPVWEHIDFNTMVEGLDREYVRRAIALGIDRETVVEALLRPINPDGEVLHNPIFMANDDRYEPHFERWSHDPDAAVELLEDNGCEPGDDGIYVCDDVRLSFRIHTDSGNERRVLAQQLMQSDLAQVGIEIEIDNDEAAAFGDRLDVPENCDGVCDYDIAMFAWAGSPDPTDNRNVYACDFEDPDDPRPLPQNWTAWCDEEASALMDAAVEAVDPDEQAELWDQVAERMADGVPIVPLFQLPMLLAWDDRIDGPVLNATNQTHFWNADEWTLSE